MTYIINLFGGPNTGKSTTAGGLFYALRLKHYDCELITEYAKELVLNERFDLLSDQHHVTKEQKRRQDIFYGKSDFLITDSPMILGAYYIQDRDPELKKSIIKDFKKQNNINFFLNNDGNIPFQEKGRHLTKEESIIASKDIKALLEENDITYYDIDTVPNERNIHNSHIINILDIIDFYLFKNPS